MGVEKNYVLQNFFIPPLAIFEACHPFNFPPKPIYTTVK